MHPAKRLAIIPSNNISLCLSLLLHLDCNPLLQCELAHVKMVQRRVKRCIPQAYSNVVLNCSYLFFGCSEGVFKGLSSAIGCKRDHWHLGARGERVYHGEDRVCLVLAKEERLGVIKGCQLLLVLELFAFEVGTKALDGLWLELLLLLLLLRHDGLLGVIRLFHFYKAVFSF